ncbi:histidine kinase [Chryseobacterium sp. R2A-55]|uniref:histidine kinase n=1 Tax=Chryseobacterium sp. R2A-55 TaxID=2744445 RepID=UPI001F183770|nr:histidine kinase [Chryseobacterium sp. R2A-55]
MSPFETIIENETYGSILYFALGGLILLSASHMMMFLKNRSNSYLLYSLYVFTSFLAYLPVAESGFILNLQEFLQLDYRSKQFFTFTFNCIYFFFFTTFLNIKKMNKKWYKIITIPVIILLLLNILSYVMVLIFKNEQQFYFLQKTFIILITIQTIISFVILMKVKNNLKYYILFGGIFLFLSSMIGEKSIRNLPFINISKKMGDFIFYMGLFVENVAFSVALGHRQRIITNEKKIFHENFVSELKKNELLKNQIHTESQKRMLVENQQINYLQEISDLKLSILQSQMNPHFIFNALNSVKYYILEHDTENAAAYLTKFSRIIRTILHASTVKYFTLEQELETIKIYAEIENLRFAEPIDFSIKVSPEIDCTAVTLPPMVLQPFIENAIVHGVSTVSYKKIHTEISKKNGFIEITISDNGIGRKEAAKKTKATSQQNRKSMGIQIANEMMGTYFEDQKHRITYIDLEENGTAKGTKVIIEIPCRNELN